MVLWKSLIVKLSQMAYDCFTNLKFKTTFLTMSVQTLGSFARYFEKTKRRNSTVC